MPHAHPTQTHQRELEQTLSTIPSGTKPHLFLHACCAPCSSYVLEYLSRYFTITIYFYNPNIMPEAEFSHRLAELRRLLQEMPLEGTVSVIAGTWEPERCQRCIRLRLEQTMQAAKDAHADFVTTTLSISPHKDASFINQCGAELAKQFDVPWLYADFKKKGGYQRSIALSHQYDLYRQDFCGCVFSAANRHAASH